MASRKSDSHTPKSPRARRGMRKTTGEQLYRPNRGEPTADLPPSGAALSARELYQREKERRARKLRSDDSPLEEARREYLALLAAEAGTAKGGRPRKNAAKKVATTDEEIDVAADDAEELDAPEVAEGDAEEASAE